MTDENLSAYYACGKNKAKAAASLGIPTTTYKDRLKKALAAESTPPTTPSERTPERIVLNLQDKLADSNAKLKAAYREIQRLEDLRGSLFGLTAQPLSAPSWPKSPLVQSKTELLPILFTSDMQVGEVVKADQVDGINEYNLDIFIQRYQTLIDRTIDLADHHVGAATFPGIIYLRGGDSLSGGIHLELLETDEMSAVPCVKILMQQEREGIRRLKERFGRVDVYSIPGNHDRTRLKPQSKEYVNTSFDTLLAWWLESLFESDPKINFRIPQSGDAYFDAMGWKFLMSHGDRMGSSGGQGFLGAGATILRGHKKLYDNFVRSGKRLDYVLTGHLHTSLKLPLGWANGSMCGYSEYAMRLRADIDAPKQWLLFCHEKRGVTAQYEVQLADRPLRMI